MRFKKFVKTIISVTVIITIVSGIIPTTLAVEFNENEKYIPSKIIKEEINKREESSKTFLCEDGSYIAVTYSEPVHFKNGEMWKEIDNSLILDNDNKYKPRASGYTIELPDELSDSSNIVAKNDKYSLSFSVNPIKSESFFSSQAQRTSVKDLASSVIYSDSNYDENPSSDDPDIIAVEKYNKAVTTVKNQKDALVYKDVFPGVDFEYIVSSGALKENIVVNEPKQEYKYSFDVDFSGLTPKNNPDGSITLMDGDNIVFILSAPYMYDMNRAENTDIKISIEKSGNKNVLTLVADKEWINSKDRVYPVIIDPTISISTSEISNVFVEDLLFANSPRSNNELRVGKNLTNLTRTYIKTTLPTSIQYGSVITSATLVLYKENYFQAWNQSNISIVACDCSNRTSWQADSVSWNNQPFSNTANGYQNVSGCQITSVSASSSLNEYVFEVKSAAQKWLDTGVNKGIMLASSNENSKTQVDFYSTRVNNSDQKPQMSIAFIARGIGSSSWITSAEAATSSTINVTCNPSWSILSSQDWLNYTDKTTDSFKARVTANLGTKTRTGVLQIVTGSVIIGSVTVVQIGSSPSLVVNKTEIIKDYAAFTDSFQIISNTTWTITTPSWISTNQNFGTGDETITISATENIDNVKRSGNITVVSGDLVQSIHIIQTSEYTSNFCDINNNSIELCPTDQYNPLLAKYCMALSFEAYNYPNGSSPLLLSTFLYNHNSSVNQILIGQGYGDVLTYNYGQNEEGAHTIGYKNIYITDNNGHLTTRPIIMVVARGSVTSSDFFSDIKSEFANPTPFEEIADTIYDNTIAYINNRGLENDNPLVVFTGHSLGAATANIAATKMNNNPNYGQNKIYCYTFGTPMTVNEGIEGNQAIAYTNIFNILNTNDCVTYMPFSWQTHPSQWKRNGIDYYVNMPYYPISGSQTPLGILGHTMSTYQNWLDTNDSLSHAGLINLVSQAIPYGLLPIIILAKCPVELTLTDENDDIVAFESQQINTVYPEITDIGIVSWITDNNEKAFFIPPNNDNITIHISAYDYGNMNYRVSRIDSGNEDETITYNSINLYPGKEFEMELSSDYDLDNTSLSIVENGEVVGEVTETNPHFISITSSDNDVTYLTGIYFTIVTDVTVSEINLYNRNYNTTMHIVPNGMYMIDYENTGDTLVWVIGFYPCIGNCIYDISVKSGDDWFNYDNVIELRAVYMNE
jgi:hypothetical protein